MPEQSRTIEAITHAVEASAKSSLAIVDELSQSRVIQQHMANTLVQICTSQQQLAERLDKLVERQNDHGKRQSDSESRILVLNSRMERHAEETNRRLERLETTGPRALPAAR